MSIFHKRPRLQEAAVDNGGGGGQQQQQQQVTDWRVAYGADGPTALKDFKEPGDFLKAYTAANGELTTLKAKAAPDWRQTLGGDDAEAQKTLARYADPKTFLKTFNEAQTKIRSGELAKPIDMKTATPEQIAEHRAANGIPAEPNGYWEKLPDGLVIGKDDQPAFDVYGAVAHKFNAPPALMHEFAQAYYKSVEAMKAEEATVDRADSLKATEALRTAWGNDYKPNMSILAGWLDGLGADIKPLFLDATLGDGTRLFNNPGVLQFLAGAARQLNPLAHVLPAGGEGGMKSLEAELANLKTMMGDRNSEYWKGPKADANQKRYRDLVGAQQQLKKS